MSDDIVTRLRDRAAERKEANEEYWRGYKFDYEIPELEDKAADEIERLRADLNNASAKANAYYELVQAYKWSHAHVGQWPDAICNLVAENYELRKAVRGE